MPPKKTEMSEGQMDTITRSTGEILDGQDKVKVRLWQTPEHSTDKPLPDEEVCINGYVYQIKRGVPVEVPEEVYNVLERAGRL